MMFVTSPGHLPESLTAQLLAAAESVPTSLFSWAGLVLGGSSVIAVIATPIVTARVRKVRQHSDTREDVAVDNAGLQAAVDAWQKFATDAVATAKQSASEALQAARESLADKDRQIEDQKGIIKQYQKLVEDVQHARTTDAEALAAALKAKHDAESRAQELTEARDRLEQRVTEAEAKLVELTMPKNVITDHRNRRDLRVVD